MLRFLILVSTYSKRSTITNYMYRILIFEELLTFGCAKYKHSKVANIYQCMSGNFRPKVCI